MLKLLENKRVKASSDIELKDRLVGVQRVVKVTKGGRAFGFSAIVTEKVRISQIFKFPGISQQFVLISQKKHFENLEKHLNVFEK